MKLIGKIFLIIGSVLFLISGVYNCYDCISGIIKEMPNTTTLWVNFGVSLAGGLLAVIAGIGGICFALGAGPFRGIVKPFAFILLFLWIFIIIVSSIAYSEKQISLQDLLVSIFSLGVPNFLYLFGYFWSKH